MARSSRGNDNGVANRSGAGGDARRRSGDNVNGIADGLWRAPAWLSGGGDGGGAGGAGSTGGGGASVPASPGVLSRRMPNKAPQPVRSASTGGGGNGSGSSRSGSNRLGVREAGRWTDSVGGGGDSDGGVRREERAVGVSAARSGRGGGGRRESGVGVGVATAVGDGARGEHGLRSWTWS